MSGVAFTISLDDLQVRGGVAGIRRALTDRRPMLADIGAEIETSTLERFETNIAPDGSAWPQSLHSKVSGKPTLVRDGTLRDSVNFRVDGNDAVEIGAGGAASEYAAVHQVGATITAKGGALHFTLATGARVTVQSVKIPARPYLGLSAADREAIPQIVGEHLARAAAEGARL